MLRDASFEEYQDRIGAMGFVRNVAGEFADRVIIRYMTTNGVIMASAVYYADERSAEYKINEPENG